MAINNFTISNLIPLTCLFGSNAIKEIAFKYGYGCLIPDEMQKDKIPCGPIFNIKEAVENPQIESRNMIVEAYHKVIGDFKLAGNPIKMSSYKDEKSRGDIPDLDEHREKIIKEFK